LKSKHYLMAAMVHVNNLTAGSECSPTWWSSPTSSASTAKRRTRKSPVRLYKLNPADPQLEATRFQPSAYQVEIWFQAFVLSNSTCILHTGPLLKDWVVYGKVRLESHPVAYLEDDSLRAAHAALCAQEQHKYWEAGFVSVGVPGSVSWCP
jgi:hypothetical protein